MNRNKLLQIIQKNLDELSEINLEMSRNSQLSKFEIELACSKAKMILQEYEFLQEIYVQESPDETNRPVVSQPNEKQKANPEESKKEDNKKNQASVSIPAPIEVEDAAIQTVVKEEAKLSAIDDIADEKVEVDIPHPEPVTEEETVIDNEPPVKKTNTENIKTESTTPDQTPKSENGSMEKITLTDQFQSKSLNDLLTASNKLDHKFASGPIAKLETAIGLNDRFQFIRELFRNDADLFRETIAKLDRMHTLEEAVKYLEERFNWGKNDSSLQFMHLVKRRFSNKY